MLPSSREKDPRNNLYVSAGRAAALVIRVFPSAFFTLHPHQFDIGVVCTSEESLSFKWRAVGRLQRAAKPHTARLQLTSLLHPSRIPSRVLEQAVCVATSTVTRRRNAAGGLALCCRCHLQAPEQGTVPHIPTLPCEHPVHSFPHHPLGCCSYSQEKHGAGKWK